MDQRNISEYSRFFNVSYPITLKISWKSIHPFFRYVASRHFAGPNLRSMEEVHPVLKQSSQLFPVLCPTNHENLFIRFSLILLETLIQNISKYLLFPQGVPHCSLYHICSILKISWKSIYPCSVKFLTGMDFPEEKREELLYPRGST